MVVAPKAADEPAVGEEDSEDDDVFATTKNMMLIRVRWWDWSDQRWSQCWLLLSSVDAFIRFNKGKMLAAGGKVDLEKIWRLFWERCNENKHYSNFIDMFEHIMIYQVTELRFVCV